MPKISGVTTLSTLNDPSNIIKPDYYTSKVSDILSLLGEWSDCFIFTILLFSIACLAVLFANLYSKRIISAIYCTRKTSKYSRIIRKLARLFHGLSLFWKQMNKLKLKAYIYSF